MTIFYLAPDANEAKGGVRTIYRHVDTLNAAGMEAAVVHARDGFRCTWFTNRTEVRYPSIALRPDDVLVVPEQVSAADLEAACPGIAKVVFNQNVYRTFWTAEVLGTDVITPYGGADVIGVLTVSVDSERYLRHAFPGLRVSVARHCIDPTVFHPEPAARRRRLAVMPRKRPRDFEQLRAILTLRGSLRDWEFAVIGGMSEAEVAATLQQSRLFISLGLDEGFGLPPAEAMACGCHVIGFDGHGGREFFVAPYAETIDDGDVIALAEAIETFVDSYADCETDLEQAAERGSRFILSTYSQEHQTADLVAFFAERAGRSARNADVGAVLTKPAIERLLQRQGRLQSALMRTGRRILRSSAP